MQIIFPLIVDSIIFYFEYEMETRLKIHSAAKSGRRMKKVSMDIRYRNLRLLTIFYQQIKGNVKNHTQYGIR